MLSNMNFNSSSQGSSLAFSAGSISCIITLHHEGYLAHRTLRSVERAAEHSRSIGLKVELIVICDRPSKETSTLMATEWAHVRQLTVDYGDPGLSRNEGVTIARGNYIAFVDGDDLISQNWFSAAWKFGLQDVKFIMHPLVNVVFGQHQILFRHPNQNEGHFRDESLIFENLWTSLSFAHRSVYTQIPFKPNNKVAGTGFEDWQFNCEAIAAGFRHRAVPNTAHFIRASFRTSVNKEAVRDGLVLAHNRLFEDEDYMKVHPKMNRKIPCE